MKQITIMILVPDRARADVMFCAERAYYHFATDDTTDDGDLPGPGDRIEEFGNSLLDALTPRSGETPLSGSTAHDPTLNSDGSPVVRVRVFVDNVEYKLQSPLTDGALSRLTKIISAYDEALGFISQF